MTAAKPRMKRRTLAEAEMLASMIPGNVEAPPDRRGLPLGIGTPEITFGIGALLFLAGIAMVWAPLALLAGGIGLALLAWRLA